MAEAKKGGFTPKSLTGVLAFLLVVLIAAIGASFYLGLQMVREYSVEVNHRLIDAEASGNQIQELQLLKGELSQSDSLITKANQLFATPSTYQSVVLADLSNYANASGVSIAGTTYGDPSSGAYTVTVTLNQPVSYSGLIQFLSNIESNLPKLQVDSITVGHIEGGDANSVKTGDIKIIIAVRE